MSDFTTPRPHPTPNSRYTPPAPKVEAEGEQTITIYWEGAAIALPATVDDWDVDVLEAFETGKAVSALRRLFGSKRYDQLLADFRSVHGRPAKLRDLTALVEQIAEAYGFEGSGE